MRRTLTFVDGHPRTGWYIAVVVTADFLLHVLESNGVL